MSNVALSDPIIERAFIGSILLADTPAQASERIGDACGAWFAHGPRRLLFESIVSVVAGDLPPSLPLIRDDLQRRADTPETHAAILEADECLDGARSRAADCYRERLRQLAVYRSAIERMEQIAASMVEGRPTPDDLARQLDDVRDSIVSIERQEVAK